MKELAQLEYFRAVARTEHMTRAANMLHISQPNLSNSITRLEESLGVKLFDRKRGKISLNQYGRTYLTYVDQAFDALERGEEKLREMRTLSSGKVSIACSMQNFYEEIIYSYCRQFSDSIVSINHGLRDTESIVELLINGGLDFALTTDPQNGSIDWEPLLVNPICVLVSSRNRLAGRSRIKISDLRDEVFICNNVGINRAMTTELCRKAGFEPNVAFESNEGFLSGVWLEQNKGVSLSTAEDLRHYVVQRVEGENSPMRALVLEEPQPYLTLGLAKLREGCLSREAQEFYDFTTKYVRDMAGQLDMFWQDYCSNH